jgi:hypothetical protein
MRLAGVEYVNSGFYHLQLVVNDNTSRPRRCAKRSQYPGLGLRLSGRFIRFFLTQVISLCDVGMFLKHDICGEGKIIKTKVRDKSLILCLKRSRE